MNEQNNEHKLKSAEEWYLESDMLRGLKWRPETVMDTIKQIQLNAYKAGMSEAITLVKKRADDYDAEHGWTDIETGTREYPKTGNDYMLELCEIQELLVSARDKKVL